MSEFAFSLAIKVLFFSPAPLLAPLLLIPGTRERKSENSLGRENFLFWITSFLFWTAQGSTREKEEKFTKIKVVFPKSNRELKMTRKHSWAPRKACQVDRTLPWRDCDVDNEAPALQASRATEQERGDV